MTPFCFYDLLFGNGKNPKLILPWLCFPHARQRDISRSDCRPPSTESGGDKVRGIFFCMIEKKFIFLQKILT